MKYETPVEILVKIRMMRSLKLISILYSVRIRKIKIGESIKTIRRIMKSVIW